MTVKDRPYPENYAYPVEMTPYRPLHEAVLQAQSNKSHTPCLTTTKCTSCCRPTTISIWVSSTGEPHGNLLRTPLQLMIHQSSPMTWKSLEQRIRAVAALHYGQAGVTENINGVNLDCVIKRDNDQWIIVEVSTRRDLEKVRTDVNRLELVRRSLYDKQQ